MAVVGGRSVTRPVAVLGVLVVLALGTGCVGVVEGDPHPAPAEPAPVAPSSASPVVPPDGFPAVLSTTTADTGTPARADELAGLQIADELEKPPGFRGVTVVVGSGKGSYQLAAPSTWSALWRVGTPYDEVYRATQPLDPGWAEEFRSTAEQADPGGGLRSVLADTGTSGGAKALIVTVSGPDRAAGDALAENAAAEFDALGYLVTARHGVVVNGVDGAYVEFSRPAS